MLGLPSGLTRSILSSLSHLLFSLSFFSFFFFFFFNDTATTEIYTLSLHDALPISARRHWNSRPSTTCSRPTTTATWTSSSPSDRKSTRLNSSHSSISYAVFCLKKKKKKKKKKNNKQKKKIKTQMTNPQRHIQVK